MMSQPIVALGIFLGLGLLIFMIFRPEKGWFWILKSSNQNQQKIVIEDILKLLYHSENQDKILNINDITHTLKEPDAVLLQAIQEMSKHGLVSLEADQVRLTESGSDYALRMVRAHRLWEKFLAEKTGYDEKDWHHIAEKKEHELTDKDTDYIAAVLGNPQFDPHGDPIPTKSGKVAHIDGIALSEMELNSIARIVHIKDKPDIIYKQILAENIHIGSQVRVVEKDADRIVFHSEGEAFKLAPIIAANITVKVLKKESISEENIARLSMLEQNETAQIIGISKEMRGESRRRLLDLGFVKGASVSIDLLNPLGDPKAFLIKGTSIALRQNQASKILIKRNQHGN